MRRFVSRLDYETRCFFSEKNGKPKISSFTHVFWGDECLCFRHPPTHNHHHHPLPPPPPRTTSTEILKLRTPTPTPTSSLYWSVDHQWCWMLASLRTSSRPMFGTYLRKLLTGQVRSISGEFPASKGFLSPVSPVSEFWVVEGLSQQSLALVYFYSYLFFPLFVEVGWIPIFFLPTRRRTIHSWPWISMSRPIGGVQQAS